MQVLRDLVIIREQLVRQGAIFVPLSPDRQRGNGWVLAAGPDVQSVRKGDVVLFDRYTGTEILVGEKREPGLVIPEGELIGVWEK